MLTSLIMAVCFAGTVASATQDGSAVQMHRLASALPDNVESILVLDVERILKDAESDGIEKSLVDGLRSEFDRQLKLVKLLGEDGFLGTDWESVIGDVGADLSVGIVARGGSDFREAGMSGGYLNARCIYEVEGDTKALRGKLDALVKEGGPFQVSSEKDGRKIYKTVGTKTLAGPINDATEDKFLTFTGKNLVVAAESEEDLNAMVKDLESSAPPELPKRLLAVAEGTDWSGPGVVIRAYDYTNEDDAYSPLPLFKDQAIPEREKSLKGLNGTFTFKGKPRLALKVFAADREKSLPFFEDNFAGEGPPYYEVERKDTPTGFDWTVSLAGKEPEERLMSIPLFELELMIAFGYNIFI